MDEAEGPPPERDRALELAQGPIRLAEVVVGLAEGRPDRRLHQGLVLERLPDARLGGVDRRAQRDIPAQAALLVLGPGRRQDLALHEVEDGPDLGTRLVGPRFGGEGPVAPLLRLGLGATDPDQIGGDPVPLLAVDAGRGGGSDEENGRESPGGEAGRGQPGVAAAPSPGPFHGAGASRQDRPAFEEASEVLG